MESLHQSLDEAVTAACKGPSTLSDEEILERVVALNAARAKEETLGKIRWLRPEFQARDEGTQAGMQLGHVRKKVARALHTRQLPSR